MIKVYKEPKKPDPIVYTEEEADRLIDAALADERDNAAIILLLMHCSLRVSEVCALRWSDVDFRRKLVTISHNYSAGEDATPKGVESAPVGLTPALAAALRACPGTTNTCSSATTRARSRTTVHTQSAAA